MAKQTSLLTFTGRLGDIIGYCRNDRYFLRSMPQTVRQTAATRRAARRFGDASRKGRLIRSAFSAALDVPCDGGHVNRLNKALIAAGSRDIAGFHFNHRATADIFFAVMPAVFKNGTVRIAAQQLPQFKGIHALEVKVIAARIDFAKGRVTGTDAALIYIDPRQPFEGASLHVDIPGNGILVVTLQVRGFRDGVVSGERKYLAADIIAAVDQQKPPCYHKPAYPQNAGVASPVRMPAIDAIIQRE